MVPRTYEQILEEARRAGGAVVIARCIAVREDPEATPEELAGADLWEATMRERHGDPKPGWLAKEVERQKAQRAEHKAFMKPYDQEFGGMVGRNGTPLPILAALVDRMAEAGVYLRQGDKVGIFMMNPPSREVPR